MSEKSEKSKVSSGATEAICENKCEGNNPEGNKPEGTNPDGNSPEGTKPEGNEPEIQKSQTTKPVGIRSPSKIGRLCTSHSEPKAGPPPLGQKNHGVVLTIDTDSFIIGQRVWVGGIRPGQIAYIGETHFAPGEWAGVVLDEPNGKNDGCVSGKRYFQCEPKKGIFSRLTRLTHEPIMGAYTIDNTGRSTITPDRSRTVSPTSSLRSSTIKNSGKHGMSIGDRVIVSSGLGSRPGILKYFGETKFAAGNWCGVQLDEPSGKNDGSVDNVRYFECPPKYGIFVPIAKVSISPTSKKTRLSRAGSRESLTSVGTMNSIASTNTSRLRMGTQKLIPVSKTVVTAPKNTFSLQDVIREKQNHIEQLMIERELDREDSHSQVMKLQKNINELKFNENESWAGVIQRRGTRLSDLRRQFRGWSGSHEEHCILHDVLSAK